MSKTDFDFLNSEIWLKYTQERYVPLEDIKHRLTTLGYKRGDWSDLKHTIQRLRKTAAVPIFLESIGKKFWYFQSDCILRKISEIEHAGTQIIEQIEAKRTFKEEFLKDATIEEAITSAIYEGANSTRAHAKKFIAEKKAPSNKDEWMLVNNYRAMQWIKQNRGKKASIQIILDLHEIVTKNTLDGDDANYSGKFRDNTIFVGEHEGMPHELLNKSIEEAIDLVTNNKRYIHGLLRGILLHYFTAYIHPFFDGNGRTARAMFYFKCMKNDLRFVELLSVSASLKERGKKYEKAFELVVEHDLDITYFIDYCLDTLIKAISRVREKVDFLISITGLEEVLGLSTNQITLLQKMALSKFEVITIEEFATQINKSREFARQELKGLLEVGLLVEQRFRKKNLYLLDYQSLKKRVASLG